LSCRTITNGGVEEEGERKKTSEEKRMHVEEED